ncbi:Glycosyltransferase involved in cell wall bisynthesis [Azotobacter beijerinckii]|uniref:Glycosyltransferase involved in cell wall bisynthesis n=1 Tax=Azotobacter beijerinckii TaxID=170623 RepID=A0A1H6RBM1_9GAMM|nr:glycosyltransferase [Azotobacter beijerinckii]SEI53248.1 Glycosyltransferase involved in cell wall bisynthesis [Azotobacter beijerinckii]
MRIVIDLQGAQSTGSRNRGIGRYTLSLVEAIIRNRGNHEVLLALSGFFPDTIEPIRASFQGLLPQENIRVWHAPGPVGHLDRNNTVARQAAEYLREAFLASLDPSVILLTSLFEGLGDDAVTSIGCLSQEIPTAVVLYDLIPLINRTPYLDNPSVAEWYESKIGHLRHADLLLAISESSRQEGIRYLGFPEDQVVNISTAADAHFYKQPIDPEQQAAVLRRYGFERSFVMYTGGIDHRKNIEGLIRAYAKLPASLRETHQLAIVCSIRPEDRTRLERLAKQHKLAPNELVLTGFVSEEDLVALYNLCKVFVFPSWHEGFGLPALEAMACGRAVIGANTSSLPEVIGCDEALFDPLDDDSIAKKLEQVLTDERFRQALERHGIEQAKNFSWDKSAQLAVRAFEACIADQEGQSSLPNRPVCRPRLAYVSPLPAERSGISDYSAELLPELARHYDIEVIVAQDSVATPWIKANCPIRTVEWFRTHAGVFDRVLYHFGNSAFHQHMFALLEEVPGVVVLHDFFLSGIVRHMEVLGYEPGSWSRALYVAHGYAALRQRFHAKNEAEVIWQYPCNQRVLEQAQGIVVHSENSRRLAQEWYGGKAGQDWVLIPHLRVADFSSERERLQAREALGLQPDDFLVCSFGLLGPSKLNHRLLDVWLRSPLAGDERCVLVFVGENSADEYGENLVRAISASSGHSRIRITGWADHELFRRYLTAADVGVQLRTLSRGETSGTVLDCMNHGLATIVNANGSMADISDEGVWKLPDEFTDTQLADALQSLWQDEDVRRRLSEQARGIIRTRHAPRVCADRYFEAIEHFHYRAASGIQGLTRVLAQHTDMLESPQRSLALAESIDRSIAPRLQSRQLLVDVSELVQRDSKSGIQRVVRSILMEWLLNPPEGYKVEPVYATMDRSGYRYARQFALRFLQCPGNILDDEPVAFYAGDVFLGLDLQPEIIPAQRELYQAMRRQGVSVQFIVYDLLPLQLAHCFPERSSRLLTDWLAVVAEADGAIGVSRTVADELAAWLQTHGVVRERRFGLNWFHLGIDIDHSAPTAGLPKEASGVLEILRERPTFLMVGAVEPRRGHSQTLAAFEQLWAQGVRANLSVVGKQGWMVEALVEKLRNHPEFGKRLFWLEGISDEYLEKIYAASTCLIAASEGEGFGLPLIEAAQHKLPIIARDIPVFREVAGEHAYYFEGLAAEDLAVAIDDWLQLYGERRHPTSDSMPWLSWKESAEQLKRVLLGS